MPKQISNKVTLNDVFLSKKLAYAKAFKGGAIMGRLLNVEQIAEVLNKAVKTVYNYLEIGIIDCGFKIGHEWRVDEKDLWGWIERQKQANGVVKAAR